jgi:hypothetical protein
VTYYGDDNRQVIVCPPERRQQLIEQRQRLLEAESQGKVIADTVRQHQELNGHKAKATVPARALPEPDASAGTENGIVARDQGPAAQKDPLILKMESIGRAESWRVGQGSD